MAPCVIDIYSSDGRAKPKFGVWMLDGSPISTMSSFHNKSQLFQAVGGSVERSEFYRQAFVQQVSVSAESAIVPRVPNRVGDKIRCGTVCL